MRERERWKYHHNVYLEKLKRDGREDRGFEGKRMEAGQILKKGQLPIPFLCNPATFVCFLIEFHFFSIFFLIKEKEMERKRNSIKIRQK